MAEIDYNAVFGIEGEEVQEAADPATEDNVGANEQEAAEPAGESHVEEGAETEQKPSDESSHHVQTDEENARYAAMRRKAEADAEKRMNAELDKSIASLGLTDPYTNKPITNHAEMQAYRQRFVEEQRKEMQEKAGMSPEDYQRFVDSLPEVQAGKAAQQKVIDLEIRAKIDSQMREIQMISPEIKSMEDLSKLDNFDKLYDMVGKGYELADAYKVLNYDRLTAKAAEAAKQQALNSIGGKNHLQPVTPRGQGAVPVPADVVAEYRALMPEATDAEIQAHYNKYARKE